MKPAIVTISLGWGIQSWTLAAMSALGELPRVDFVIHSDTTHELQATYEFARKWTPWLEEHGIQVITVNDSIQAAKVFSEKTDPPWFTKNKGVFIPAYSVSDNNTNGQLRRQCTHRWKVVPMRRWLLKELRRRKIKRVEGIIETWLGITVDEWTRAKDSDVKYIKHRYPFLEKNISRGDCVEWLKKNNLGIPVKSACFFCPYRRNKAWQELKRENGEDWHRAIEADEAIRNVRPPHLLYVHDSRIPLVDAVPIPEDYGFSQPGLFDEEKNDTECDSGYCFL